MNVYPAVWRLAWILALTPLAWGCGKRQNQYVPPPAPTVTVAQPVRQEVTRYLEHTGTTTGVETVEVRARVKGFVDKIHFAPGAHVKAGDLLFTIDQRTFRAAVQQAQAELKGKKAAADITAIQTRKVDELFKQQAANELERDEWHAKLDQSAAEAEYAQATLDQTQLELSFTEVRSPIAGIVSDNRVDLGTLVGASEPTLLTTVIRQDQMFAYFDVSEREVLDVTSDRAAAGLPRRQRGSIPIEMGLANEVGYPHSGAVDFADNTVRPDTGTLRVRAVFDNPDERLIPGVFVRLRVPRSQAALLLLPDAAVGQDQAGKYVLTVNAKNEVERKAVTVSKPIGSVRAVESGLQGDEWVIINGMLRTRPGGAVEPKQSTIPVDLLPKPAQFMGDVLVPMEDVQGAKTPPKVRPPSEQTPPPTPAPAPPTKE